MGWRAHRTHARLDHGGGRRGRVAFVENFLEHLDHFAGIGALELDEFAYHLRRRHVDLVHDANQSPDDAGVFRDEDAARFRQGQKRGVRLGRRKILPEHLLKLDRVGVIKLEEKADDLFARGNVGFIGNDRDAGVARAAVGPDHFDDVVPQPARANNRS